MATNGHVPLSSGLYCTKRRALSSYVTECRGSDIFGDFDKRFSQPDDSNDLKGDKTSTNAKDFISVRQDLLRLGLAAQRFPPFATDDELSRGLAYLSHHPALLGNREALGKSLGDAKLALDPSTAIKGSIHQATELLKLRAKERNHAPLKPMEDVVKRQSDATDIITSPLSVNEVALLIACALKLEATDSLDRNLENKLELSTRLWRQSGRVPNIVYPQTVQEQFENRSIQCTSCGLRFDSTDSRQLHTATAHQASRSFSVWATLDTWVNSPMSPPGRNVVCMYTLDSLKRLLAAVGADADYGCINWLRLSLDIAPIEEHNEEDKEDTFAKVDDATVHTKVESDPQVLWKWALFSCDPSNEDSDDRYSNITCMDLDQDKGIPNVPNDLLQVAIQQAGENMNILLNIKPIRYVQFDTSNTTGATAALDKSCGICLGRLLHCNVMGKHNVSLDVCKVLYDWNLAFKALTMEEIDSAVSTSCCNVANLDAPSPWEALVQIACLRPYPVQDSCTGTRQGDCNTRPSFKNMQRRHLKGNGYPNVLAGKIPFIYLHCHCLHAIYRRCINTVMRCDSLAPLATNFDPNLNSVF